MLHESYFVKSCNKYKNKYKIVHIITKEVNAPLNIAFIMSANIAVPYGLISKL